MLPLSLEFKAAGALVAIAAALLAFHRFEASQQAKGAATCEASHDESDRAEEQRRLAAKLEIDNETQRLVSLDRVHAVALAGAAPGLRNAVAAAIVCHGDPPPISVSSAASNPTVLRSDVLGEIETRLRDLGGEADVRRTSGLGCQREYGSLKK